MNYIKSKPALLDAEISPIVVLFFFRENWKIIAGVGILGFVFSIVYLVMTPNQYQAIVNITMGKVAPGGANVEDPQALVNRMSIPTGFNMATLNACGLKESNNQNSQLSNSIKLSIPRGVANVVELRVTRNSPELAASCAQSIFEAIANTQSQMIDSTLKEATKAKKQKRLNVLEDRLAQDRLLLAKAEQPKSPPSPTYFAILSEIRNLEDERVILTEENEVTNLQSPKLQSPIYSPSQPILPKKTSSLLLGFLVGICLGSLIALGRRVASNLKVPT